MASGIFVVLIRSLPMILGTRVWMISLAWLLLHTDVVLMMIVVVLAMLLLVTPVVLVELKVHIHSVMPVSTVN